MKTYNWGLTLEVYETWAWMPIFSPEECSLIIDIGNSLEPELATVDHNIINEQVRTTNISWIPVEDKTKWIFQRCTDAIISVNERFFNFDLYQIESLQFTAYDKTGSFYKEHMDTLNNHSKGSQRKLSFSVQLSDPNSYSGGDLVLKYKPTPEYALKDHGVATFFPSYCLHEVTPITSGKRYSLVGWVTGPRFK